MDRMRKTALAAGLLYLATFVFSIPAAFGLYDGRAGRPDRLRPRRRQRHQRPLGRAVRDHHRAHRHRHRRRPLPGDQALRPDRRPGLRDLPGPRGLDDLRRRAQRPRASSPSARTSPARDAAGLTTTAHALVALKDWTFLLGPGFMPAINALCLGHGHVPVPARAPHHPDDRPDRRPAPARLQHRHPASACTTRSRPPPRSWRCRSSSGSSPSASG